MTQLEYIESVFDVIWRADCADDVFWRPWPADHGPWRAMAICSDFFAWATADAEEITPDDVAMFEKCLVDLQPIEATGWLTCLFAARKRKLRPMRVAYEGMSQRVAALFDAAGPERTDSEN